MTTTKTEPIALGALVQLVLNAALLILSAFHVASLSGEQTAAVFGFTNMVVIVVVAVKTRSIVFAPATVEQITAGQPLDGDQGVK